MARLSIGYSGSTAAATPVGAAWRWLCAALLGAAGLAAPASADPMAEVYKGRTVTIIISSSPGGGYDTLSRAIGRHIGKHIPGNPQIVAQNMPGAGGIVATNYMYNIAPKDGLVFACVQNNAPLEPLFGTKSANYDATKFNWIGTPSVEVGLMAVWHASGVRTIEDARSRQLTAGSSGANSAPSFYAHLLNDLLGMKIKVIAGYPGQTQAFLAMERGELDFYGTTFWSALTSTKPDWIANNRLNFVVQYGPQKVKELPDVPFLRDLIKSPDERLLLLAAEGPLTLGRPYMLPPGVPAERVATIRNAFFSTLKDPDFLADAARQKLDVSTPRRGEELQRELEEIYRTPPHIVERLRRIAQQ